MTTNRFLVLGGRGDTEDNDTTPAKGKADKDPRRWWRTKDGTWVRYVDMDDMHLLHAIRLVQRSVAYGVWHELRVAHTAVKMPPETEFMRIYHGHLATRPQYLALRNEAKQRGGKVAVVALKLETGYHSDPAFYALLSHIDFGGLQEGGDD